MSKPLRTIGLWILIIFDVALIATLALMHQYYWTFVFASITSVIGIFEGLSACEKDGKTISWQYWQFRQAHPWVSLLAMIFFGLAMAGLILHLLA